MFSLRRFLPSRRDCHSSPLDKVVRQTYHLVRWSYYMLPRCVAARFRRQRVRDRLSPDKVNGDKMKVAMVLDLPGVTDTQYAIARSMLGDSLQPEHAPRRRGRRRMVGASWKSGSPSDGSVLPVRRRPAGIPGSWDLASEAGDISGFRILLSRLLCLVVPAKFRGIRSTTKRATISRAAGAEELQRRRQ